MSRLYQIRKHDSPIISLALHDGHFISENMQVYMALSEHERFREEDPYTAIFADLPTTQVVVHSSRFMVDMNRPIEKCIYLAPEDAWGLKVWKSTVPTPILLETKAIYQQFYQDITELIEEKINEYGYFFILDIHSYNHRRDDPHEQADVRLNPEINLGTAYNSEHWHPVIEQFKNYLSGCILNKEFLDVRENIKFKGGGFAQWLTHVYGKKGGIISIEFKKTFMDEWTGRADIPHIMALQDALKGALPVLRSALKMVSSENKRVC